MVSISIGWLLSYYCVNYIYQFCNLTDYYNIIVYNAAGDMCTYTNYVRVHTHTHIYIYIYICMHIPTSVYVSMCGCTRVRMCECMNEK